MAGKIRNSMNKLRILQWNIQGVRAKQTELQTMLSDNSITIACIQETLLENSKWNPPKNYSVERNSHIAGEGNRGVAVLLHNSIPYTRLNINTTLEAIAVNVHQEQSYTICSIYLSPNKSITKEDLKDLLSQLPSPFLILGDFNAKHPYGIK